MEFFKPAFYYVDLIIGFSFPLCFYLLYRKGKIDKAIWRLFLLGSALGLLWEVPIFVLSGQQTSLSLIYWIRPLPLPYIVFMIAHTLWDGGLFLIGLWFVSLFCQPPWFKQFKVQELLVFVICGQVSALIVEVSSVVNDGWVYVTGYWWNPVLFDLSGHPITLLPQLIWLVAPVVYYVIMVNYFNDVL